VKKIVHNILEELDFVYSVEDFYERLGIVGTERILRIDIQDYMDRIVIKIKRTSELTDELAKGGKL
jgi:hypothetical protein